MDHDDDVEHLFSWLQTPDLRYREFAGAREITDSVVIAQQQRANNTPVPQDAPQAPPRRDAQVAEEYPANQFPDQGETRVEVLPEPRYEPRPAPAQEPGRVIREETASVRVEGRQVVAREDPVVAAPAPAIIAPVPMASETPPRQDNGGVFALDAGGRSSMRAGLAEWVGPRPPLIQTPSRQTAPPAAAQPRPTAPPAQPRPTAPPSAGGGGLLGGAYRESDANGHGSSPAPSPEAPSSPDSAPRSERTLDAVFGRLAGGRGRVPDPRDRMRHIPGFNPPAGRPR
jgi:hypothetical protein